MSQRDPHRFDLAAALARSLRPVDLREFQRRNVGRVRLLRPDELAGSVREAIERALADHRAELERLREATRRASGERETLRTALAEEGARRASAEAALAEARGAARAEVETLRADLARALSDLAGARAEAERLRAERDEARGRLALTLVEREKIRGELVAERTAALPAPAAKPASEGSLGTIGEHRSDGSSSPGGGPPEGEAPAAAASAPVAGEPEASAAPAKGAGPPAAGGGAAERTEPPPGADEAAGAAPPSAPDRRSAPLVTSSDATREVPVAGAGAHPATKSTRRVIEVGGRRPAPAPAPPSARGPAPEAKPAPPRPKVAFFGFGPALSVPEGGSRTGAGGVWRTRRSEGDKDGAAWPPGEPPEAQPPEGSD